MKIMLITTNRFQEQINILEIKTTREAQVVFLIQEPIPVHQVHTLLLE